MQLVIQGHGGFEISSRFENYTRNKVERLERFLPGIEDVRVEVSKQSAKDDAPKALQLTVRRRRTLLRVEERNPDPYTALDAALDKMHQRIARYKGRRTDKKRIGVIDTELEEAEALPAGVMDALQESLDGVDQKLVRTKSFTVVPMSTDEAIEQMELLGHDFFVFMHDDDGEVKVVYRRKSGDYGLLQPEK